MKERTDITFNDYELGAINIVVLQEIYTYEKLLEEDNFEYPKDKESAKTYLKTLHAIDDKINKRGDK